MADAIRNAQGDTEEETQMLDAIERWVARELKPIVREYDHADRYPTNIVEQMKELGLFGATISPEYGGMGLSASTYAKIVMSISSVWMSISGIINSHLMLALAIEKFGTPQQRTRWLPKLATGEVADSSDAGRAAYHVLTLLTPYMTEDSRQYMVYLRSKYRS